MTWYPRSWEADEWLILGTLKIGIDGSMGAQTALLYQPYTNDPSTSGVYVGDQERNKVVVKEEHELGGEVAIHAIGDKAINEAVNRIEEVLKGKPRPDHRYRIEHFEYPTDEDIQRTRKLGIIASMQPNFVGEWAWPGGMYDTRVGEKRLERCNPYRGTLGPWPPPPLWVGWHAVSPTVWHLVSCQSPN